MLLHGATVKIRKVAVCGMGKITSYVQFPAAKSWVDIDKLLLRPRGSHGHAREGGGHDMLLKVDG